MLSRNRYDGIDEYIVTKIRFHARQLIHTGLFSAQDPEDIEQTLMVGLLRRLGRFDPTRASRHTFIACVLANIASTLVEAAKAEKCGTQFQHDGLETSTGRNGPFTRANEIPDDAACGPPMDCNETMPSISGKICAALSSGFPTVCPPSAPASRSTRQPRYRAARAFRAQLSTTF